MLTRDSHLWNILFVIGLAMAAVLIAEDDPSKYGLSPVMFKWVQLLAVGFVAAGKMGNSPLRGENDPNGGGGNAGGGGQ